MSKSRTLPILICAIALTFLSLPAQAQVTISKDDVTVRLGLMGQMWADWTQDTTVDPLGNQAYQQNFYLRRARIIMNVDIGDQISLFVQTDDPKLGLTPKSLTTGFLLQDAMLEWRPTKVFQVVGGLMIVPFTRNGLDSPLNYVTLDVSAMSTVTNTVLQNSALRDAGFEVKGFFAKDKLLYRVGVYAGERDANAHDSPRVAGYLQYDFFTPEKTYLFTGTSLGKTKTLAVDGGFDRQGSYKGYSANIAAGLPVNKGDELDAQFQYIYYNGGTKFPTIAEQNDYLLEAGYYARRAKLEPFLKYESQNFVPSADAPKDINRFGAGATYYIRGQNLKWTAMWLRALPQNTTAIKATNEFTMQLQLMWW